jgi:hypothetical protein
MVRRIALSLCLSAGCYSGHSEGPDQDAEGVDDGADGADGADGGGGTADDGGGPGIAAGAVPMRRMTRAQFVQSTRDLLQIPQWVPEAALPDEGLNEEEFQLPNMVSATVTTTSLGYSRYRAVAKEAVGLALATDADMTARLGCTPTGAEDPCVREYLTLTAERAFSRAVPADDAVLATLLDVVADGETRLGSVRLGLQWALISLVQSPEYIYFFPAEDPDAPGVMDDYSKARSISLMFRDSIPDEELLARARAGELSDPAVVEAEIDRLIEEMIDDPSRRTAVERFFSEWWSSNVIEALGKDPTAFPEFDDDLKLAMKHELDAWLADILFDRRMDFRSVLVSDRLFVNDRLAALYGIEGEFGPELQATDLAADSPRSGLLTMGGFLSVMAHPALTSPAARGKFISERLLCLRIPPPPPNVDATIPPPEGPETKRERFERHTTDPTCAGCHALMDPSGLALEEFDAIGRFRESETVVFDGQTYELDLDTTGQLGGVAFSNSREMSAVVAEDPNFAACVTRQLLRQSLGRELDDDQEAALDELVERFSDSDYDFLALMRATAMHGIFTAFEEGQ